MIKILHIIRQASVGGAFRSLIATAKYLSIFSDYQQRIVSLLSADPVAIKIAEEAGINVIALLNREAILQEIGNADIVHLHFWNSPEIYEFIRSGLPPMRLLIKFNVAGCYPPQIITKELIDYADFALATSPYAHESTIFQELPEKIRLEKTGMIYGATDFARLANFSPKPHNTFNVGYIGTVGFVKMHPNYVPMSAGINIPNIKFIICGKGDACAKLKTEVEALQVKERFEFQGYVEDIRSVIEVMDVFGYPLCKDNYSTVELVLQEVMYAGIPAVIFPYGGASRTVVDNYTGLIVKSELEYKQAIEYLYHHPEERQRLGENARKYAEQMFGGENAAKATHKLYQKLIRSPKAKKNWGKKANQSQKLYAADLFIQSIGNTESQFLVSMTSQDIQELLDADKKIAESSPLLYSKGAGGIFHYRSYYQKNGYLRLWSGLVLQQQGKHSEAIAEFAEANELGTHWRTSWYLAKSALELGKLDLAEEALTKVLAAEPDFSEAQEKLRYLGKETNIHTQKQHSVITPTKSETRQVVSEGTNRNLLLISSKSQETLRQASLPAKNGMTIFAIPKPFKEHIGVIQTNAIKSWTLLKPKPEIIIFGEEEGTEDIVKELGVRHVPNVQHNEYGTPLLSDMFAQAHKLASHDILTYVNSDIMLVSDFIPSVKYVSTLLEEFLIIGRRWNINITTLIDFNQQNWENELRRLVNKEAVLNTAYGMDYFTYPRHLFAQLPEFAIGRAAWDTWMVYNALIKKYPVVDASEVIMCVHQNHDYAHLPKGQFTAFHGIEAQRNRELGGYPLSCRTSDATWCLKFQQSNNTPRVSVVIPARNRPLYTQKAIESVLRQTYTSYEIIVVNNGPKDIVRPILEPYQNKIQYVYLEGQKPEILAALNHGINLAQGEFITFLHPDSYFLPERLALQVNCFDKGASSIDFVHSGWQIVNSSGEITLTVKPWCDLPELDWHIWKLWKIYKYAPTKAMMFRSDRVKLLGGFNTHLKEDIADVDFVIRMGIKFTETAWLRQPTYCLRLEEGTVASTPPKFVEHLELVLDNYFSLPEVPDWMRILESRARYNTWVWGAWSMYHHKNLTQMAKYLERAFNYTPYSTEQTVSDWVDSFIRFASEYGYTIDADRLTKIPEWEQVIEKVLTVSVQKSVIV
ncbi:glycosyltransferase [Dapis sp. BLCC M229]|uniref:glycosyltransferase n=1 Tax=Dapis sp. BLCC M229 TaxID=3400188 RepID=UPI003CEF6A96